MHHYTKVLVALLVLTTLAGCASHPEENVKLVQEPDSLAELQTVAAISAERLRSIQMLLQEEREKRSLEQRRRDAMAAAYIPEGFEVKASMKTTNWPDVICKRLGQLAGYEIPTVVGDRPKAPFIVDIDKRGVPLWELVHELGLKTGKAFVMEIHENAKLVRCIYARPEA